MSNKDEQSMNEHMALVTNAITKINQGQNLENTDIREILKSLMNAQIFNSDQNDENKKMINESLQKQNEKIKKLEDFLFRKNHKREDKNG